MFSKVYPLVWEIPIEDVYFDGTKLPRSTLSASTISLSGVLDTVSPLTYGLPNTNEAPSHMNTRATPSSAGPKTSSHTSSPSSQPPQT